MTRAYVRLLPASFARKAFALDEHGNRIPGREPYPPAAVAAFYGILCLADQQPYRGHFQSERLLRVLLEGGGVIGSTYSRTVPYLIEHKDLVREPGGTLYVDGWNELQEGDLTVVDRMNRYRGRKRSVTPPATPDVTDTVTEPVTDEVTPDVTEPTVYTPSSGSGSVSGSSYLPPSPPLPRGARNGLPRATGENPRAKGTAPRQVQEREARRAPIRLGELVAGVAAYQAQQAQAEPPADDVDFGTAPEAAS